MLSIEVFTNNKWRSLDFEDVNLSLNYNIVNLENPSKYKSEFSKTVELPLTANNKQIFGFGDRLDSIQTNLYSLTQSIQARIFNESSLLFEGKLNITNVDLKNEKISGNFYSQLNSWYNKMLEFNFDNGFPNILPDNFQIDKSVVKNSWESNPDERNENLVLPNSSNYSPYDFIGFAPTINGELNNFNSKSMTWGTGGSRTIGSVWEGFSLTDNALSDAKSICEAPTERMMMQYRSYNQKPYFYVDKLCQLVQHVSNQYSDIPNIELDNDWFNKNNPYYKNVVYLLPNLLSETENTDSAVYTINFNSNITTKSISNLQMPYGNNVPITVMQQIPLDNISPDPKNLIQNNCIVGNGTNLDLNINFNVQNMAFSAEDDSSPRWDWPNAQVKLYGTIKLKVELRYEDGTVVPDSTKYIKTWNDTNSVCNVQKFYTNNKFVYNWWLQGGSYSYNFNGICSNVSKWKLYAGLEFTSKKSNYIHPLYQIYNLWQQNTPFYRNGHVAQKSNDYFQARIWGTEKLVATSYNTYSSSLGYKEIFRSGRYLKTSDIWKTNYEYSPFQVFVKYCKSMNLIFDYDELTNTLTVLPRQKFLQNAYNKGIENWTNKIDFNQEIGYTPLSWENKYILFNYGETAADKLSDYKKKYSYNYGTKKIITSYNYNNDSKELYENNDIINASAEMSEYLFSIKDIYKTATEYDYYPQAHLMNESFIINKKDNSSADVQNCFFFRTANSTWDNTINILSNNTTYNGVWITDDSDEELRQDTYCYQYVWSEHLHTWNAVRTYSRPVFTKFNSNVCLHFAVPEEDYFNPNVITRNLNDIYTMRWSKLFEEIYNEQNKLLTCYIWLNPDDYQNIRNGKFVIIDDVVYLINQIYDYTPDKYKPTKISLVQVMDIEKYFN